MGVWWEVEEPKDPAFAPSGSQTLKDLVCSLPAHQPACQPWLHLDAVHGLLGLRHSSAGGWVPLGHQLGGTQVFGPKYDTIAEVFTVTGT